MRHVTRHIHKTLVDYIVTRLEALHWGNAGQPLDASVNAEVNFGTTPVTYLSVQPEEESLPLVPNTVAVTTGEQPAALDGEMGSPRGTLDIPLFVDVYGDKLAITTAILDDLRYEILDNLVLAVRDWSAGGVATTLQMEIDREAIVVRRPDAADSTEKLKRNWRVLVATVHVDNLWLDA